MCCRKLFHFVRVILAAAFLLVLYSAQTLAAPGGSEPSANSISREPQIFVRVLKETLDSAGLGEFVPGPFGVRSPIETGIQAEYIPTVGLLVRVPVSFPLSAPAGHDEAAPSGAEPKDLWEKYSDSGSRYEERDRVIQIQKPGDNWQDTSSAVQLDATRISRPRPTQVREDIGIDKAGNILFQRFPPGLDLLIGNLGAAPFDEARVAKFRETLLDVVAQYGHRVSSLQDGERIIIVVDAPTSGGPLKLVVAGKEDEQIEESMSYRSKFGSGEEHILLTVPKAAVVSATTREAIAQQVTEKHY